MKSSFFFYDLETSGISPRSSRIMQFAGQRTDMDLKPVGEPINVLIRLSEDVLPEPDAVLLTGITPQKAIDEGVSEVEFLKLFYKEVVRPNTIFLGFNNIRFDDEFMRFINYRNYYDAYGWQWQNNCSRWDLLDVVRMTRALRPGGIKWPFASDGKPANRLELLTNVNKLPHANAHDALGDVMATIELAKLIKRKQPELFKYLLEHHSKKEVTKIVDSPSPFVYTSGHYSSEVAHTAVVTLLARHDKQDAALVYDLKFDPTPFMGMSVDELIEAWRYDPNNKKVRLPLKTLKFNRSPAVAPLGVIKDEKSQSNIGVKLSEIKDNLKILRAGQSGFASQIAKAVDRMDKAREEKQMGIVDNIQTVDERLYDGFISGEDNKLMINLREGDIDKVSELAKGFKDERLRSLSLLYKARNFPASISSEEKEAWDKYLHSKLFSGNKESRIARYFARLEELTNTKLTKDKLYLLEELRLYGESIMP